MDLAAVSEAHHEQSHTEHAEAEEDHSLKVNED
jgi:hypothetical protein